ncbi:MAG: acetyl/propionyl/methylcrotonyl-CoA carboxylase subunit alpha [Beijerinckiaceae bacterium]
MFDKILIANRGEIACRIVRTARRLGVATVAVYSEADAAARHVRIADEAVFIGPSPARESYLVIDKIIEAAKRTGAQAIHPGYGFLSENEAFCKACDEAGLVFIGPPVQAIHAMGSKSEAKKLMEAAGVPLTPGYHGDDQDAAKLKREADAIGYPVMIKAAAGGGGKGMRQVMKAEDFDAALASCKREAAASFGSDHVLVEKYIVRPRHVEIQVFGDSHGNCVHLFERDCSVQRRHQKVLEEAPAPGMTAERRRQMGEAAVAAAKAVNYVGAGTVEFIATQDGRFYFMEMNTRLQVEHPVTEMITGLDLVEWQLRVASGERLPLTQEQLHINGHALEARVYAEDPAKNFLPSTGRLVHLAPPAESLNVRVDTGVEEGDSINPFYDPMIAKLIVWDDDRDRALSRMQQALADYRVVGVNNNIDFLSRLVASPAFASADLDTGLIEREKDYLFPGAEQPPAQVFAIAALSELLRGQAHAAERARASADPTSPWHARDGWRLNGVARRSLIFRFGDEQTIVVAANAGEGFSLAVGDATFAARGKIDARGKMRVEFDGVRMDAAVVAAGHMRHVFLDGRAWRLACVDPLHVATDGAGGHGGLLAPMPGKVIALLAEAGAKVDKGQPLLILEAMKMEHTITAPSDGVLKAHRFSVGDQVGDGAELVDFEPHGK